MPPNDGVTLEAYSPADHRTLIERWLVRPHVARWWGDPGAALDFVDHQAADRHAVIAVHGTAVGYICWQQIPVEEKAAAGLSALPDEHIDIDLFLGEPELMGRGVGTTALCLLVLELEERGASSIGLAAADDNARALSAYAKAGFHVFAHFSEEGHKMRYLRRGPVPHQLPDVRPSAPFGDAEESPGG